MNIELILRYLDHKFVKELLCMAVPRTAKSVKAVVYVLKNSPYCGTSVAFNLSSGTDATPVTIHYEHNPDKEPRTLVAVCDMPTYTFLIPITGDVTKESLQEHYLPDGYFASSAIEGSFEITLDGVGADQPGAGSCRVTDQGLLIYAKLNRPAGLQFYSDLLVKYPNTRFNEV